MVSTSAHKYTCIKQQSFTNCWTIRQHTSHVTTMWLKRDEFTSYSLPRDATLAPSRGGGQRALPAVATTPGANVNVLLRNLLLLLLNVMSGIRYNQSVAA
jgi:hypothetical protein